VMLALETRWARRRIAQSLAGGPPAAGQSPAGDLKLDTISPLLDKAQSYVLAIDTSERVTVDLVAAVASEKDAKPVADTIQALLTLGKNAVQGLRHDSRNQAVAASEAVELAFQAADSLLDKAVIRSAGRFVQVRANSSLDLSEVINLVAPAVSAAQSASRRQRSINNLKQIVLAIHNYASNNNHLPTPVLLKEGPRKSFPYSWRVAILPYLEQDELYKQYNFEEPWDGPNNRRLLDKMPAVFSYPGPDGSPSSQTHSAYFVFDGEQAALSPVGAGHQAGMSAMMGTVEPSAVPSPAAAGRPGAAAGIAPGANARPARSGDKAPTAPTFESFTDGTSNTIMVVEAKRDIPWTKPEDIPFDPKASVPDLGGFNANLFNAAFADGSVRTISNTINRNVLKYLITRGGGEVISQDSF
jgi:Protein of unknown function (DUF1559)